MANMAQVIGTGVMGIAGAAVGSGLTYWLGALNGRPTKQDRTRLAFMTPACPLMSTSRATFNGVAVAQRR
jgi:membrane protein DedA with SNARE-associated domain